MPVGSRMTADGERPRAVSEYLLERMLLAGADKICFVIAPGKSDIMEYYGGEIDGASLAYVVQPRPLGLCDAIFRAAPLVRRDEQILVGLPDTIWFPREGLGLLGDDALSFLLFPVEQPELFDAVMTDGQGRVTEIQVKQTDAGTNWVWGAFRMPGTVLHDLYDIWQDRQPRDEYIGTLVNAYIHRGGSVWALRAGAAYVDVGTLHGYREALNVLLVEKKTADAKSEADGADRAYRPVWRQSIVPKSGHR